MKKICLVLGATLLFASQQAGAESGVVSSPPGGSANAVGPVVSSAEANQQFENQRFTMAAESEMRSRMPVLDKMPLSLTNSAAAPAPGVAGVAFGSNQSGVSPTSFGTAQVPFTTSRVLGGFTNEAQAFPYRQTGKLYMAFGGTTYNYVCSASLIGKSLLVTAAHCVFDYGKKTAGWANKVRFVPAMDGGSQPYGYYESSQYLIPTSYYNGNDTCSVPGIVCNNDLALVHLRNNSKGEQAGVRAGYYGYGWNNYSFATPAASFQGVFGNKPCAAITQLGYPQSHDSGNIMQINTANGCYAPGLNGALKNTQLAGAMTGGSSGGPWHVNFGENAAGASYGSAGTRNVVVGVTSWGYTNIAVKVQGASSFAQNLQFPGSGYGTRGAGNIGKLVYDACDNPAFTAWKLQSRVPSRCR